MGNTLHSSDSEGTALHGSSDSDDAGHLAPSDWDSVVKTDPYFAQERIMRVRKSLGLDTPSLAPMLENSEFISVGCYCGVALTLESMGLRKAAYPFDWVRAPIEGILECLETEFEDFLSFERIQPGQGGQKFFFDTSWGGSFWHHDIEDEGARETFARRIDRFLGIDRQDDSNSRFFIHVANSVEELSSTPALLSALQELTPATPVFLLVIIDLQKRDCLMRAQNESPNLLFYTVQEDLWKYPSDDWIEQRHRNVDTYSVGVGAALRFWNQSHRSAKESVRSFSNLAQLEAIMVPFDGGECTHELYKPVFTMETNGKAASEEILKQTCSQQVAKTSFQKSQLLCA
jgi:hypothetical protein|mmetsp:Transcript_55067/g.87253  ORF Transcript_55067/g.87253 Transcript_55067/m.87253 type:complete len:345 (+) Transcript_55067:27-1061(+)